MYEQERSEIQTLKSYLLSQIPTTPLPPNDILLSPNSVALTAAIAGLDKELGRLDREERLVKKFTATNTNSSSNINDMASSGELVAAPNKKRGDDVDMEYVKMTKEDAHAATAEDMDLTDKKDEEEWEEADASEASPAKKHPRQDEKKEDAENAQVCQKLASSSVARIANANVKVATPLGALGLALHTALVELVDENENGGDDPIFRCTGVPDVGVSSQLLGVTVKGKKGGGGGFAPPIRELPKGELVPSKWEDTSSDGEGGVIAFRYKCGSEVYSTSSGHTNDSTTLYLALHTLEGKEVSVTFGTLPSKGSSGETIDMKFPLGQHVNLDGFQAAKTKNGGRAVSPSLFYIGLSALLIQFSSTFMVLPKARTGDDDSAAIDMPTTKADMMGQQFDRSVPLPSVARVEVGVASPTIPPNGAAVDTTNCRDPLRVMDSRRDRHGDFEGDLLPGGPQPGGLHEGPRRGMGSQVGPDHPMFDRNFGDEGYGGGYDDDLGLGNGGGGFGLPGVGGGMGMRPRFDPFGPPGGPTEPGRGGQFPGRGSRLGRGRGRGGRGSGRGRVPPGGFGDPNPDHMTPPGGDYFS